MGEAAAPTVRGCLHAPLEAALRYADALALSVVGRLDNVESGVTLPISQRTRFLERLVSQAGVPYQWGGKGRDSSPRHYGFDCSGLVTWAYHAAGGFDWRETHNANTLLHVLEAPPPLQPLRGGTLVFYGRQGAYATPRHCVCGASEPMHLDCISKSEAHGFANADHVMVWLGEGLLWGACGGGHTTTTPEEAQRVGAMVRSRTGFDYRPDRIALRQLRFSDEG